MCGIAGKVIDGVAGAEHEAIVRRMCDVLAHRGPDGHGVLRSGPAVLGHRRLAILDLSPRGRQPMSSPDGRVHLVFNGEIYNYRDLRRLLQVRGHRFRSDSDTEVLLAAYLEYGQDAVHHLRGMFAFAIYDEREATLFAARDRLGKKPFYYRTDRDGLTFASEMQALAADPGMRREIAPAALDTYLSLGYVPAPLSIFTGVHKLPPGYTLTCRGGQVKVARYWHLEYGPKLNVGEEEAAELVLDKLREAVRLRLISDVPLGAFLSGGVDSSLVVSLMAEVGSVRTFSIGFQNREYDERRHARAVAAHCGTTHEEFVVEPSAADILPDLARHFGEPFADSSAVPTYYLAQMTRRRVTVALTGDGGDEAFAGYDRHVAAAVAERVEGTPNWLLSAVARGARALSRRPRRHSLLHRVDRFCAALTVPEQQRYGQWVSYFSAPQKGGLYTRAFAERVSGLDALTPLWDVYDAHRRDGVVDRTLAVDTATYLPGDLLPKMDAMSMASSLEARSPLLDHEFLELAGRLPPAFKVRRLTGKYLLRQVAKRRLPAGVVDRPKMGFGVPVDHWMRVELQPLVNDALLGTRAVQRGYFDPAFVRCLIEEQRRGARRWHHLLWNLLMLELWHRELVDTRPPEPVQALPPAIAGRAHS